MLRRLAVDAVRRPRRWSPPGRPIHSLAASPVSVSALDRRPATEIATPLRVRRQQQRRSMSDNLLGHSPMAQRVPTSRPAAGGASPGSAGPSWGVDSNTAGGGVWAQTSAKRDKIAELKLELDWDKGHRTLDDAASHEEKLDLWMADGLRFIARAVDGAWDAEEEGGSVSGEEKEEDAPTPTLGPSSKSHPLLVELDAWLTSTESSRGIDAPLSRDHFDAHLAEASRILDPDAASPLPPPAPPVALRDVRDFVAYDPDPDADDVPPPDVDSDFSTAEVPLDECVRRLRLLTTRAAASRLRDSWDSFTASTDADVDRAAVRHEAAEPRSSLPLGKVNAVLRSHAFGTCPDRLAALWDLNDRDGDGALDQATMDDVVLWSMGPVEGGLRALFEEVVEARGVRDVLLPFGVDMAEDAVAPKKGWRQRRREAKIKKGLLKMFDKTIANHFDVEVETPHRLRCIYAWAEKSHQDNKLESVLVDSGTVAGRKRYVELQPKISLAEFQEVQKEHYPHIDRMGEELLSSFREDLLVAQGKGRQNRELKRDCALFIGGVSLIDACILML